MADTCRTEYKTPEGFTNLILNSDGEYVTEVRFKTLGECIDDRGSMDVLALAAASRWLDSYFSGNPMEELPPIKIHGLTPFRKDVLQIIQQIPYGEEITYKDIAQEIANKGGIKHMSAQAVGQAVGWNPICIIIPCHRVMGSDGSLTGYSGGLENKMRLLIHEQESKSRLLIYK